MDVFVESADLYVQFFLWASHVCLLVGLFLL